MLPALIFAGTSDFSVPVLAALHQAGFPIRAVITQPDQPSGRGQKLQATPVKQFALTHQLPFFTFERLDSNAKALIQPLQAIALIVVSYGLLIPQAFLSLFPWGGINVHPSLLPRWRGAAPIIRAILAGDCETGMTIMKMTETLDAGDIFVQVRCPILSTDTQDSLSHQLSELGGKLLIDTLHQLENGTATTTPQDHSKMCYAHKIQKTEAGIQWQEPAEVIDRQIRAFYPKPIAYCFWNEQPIKILGATLESSSFPSSPGTVLHCGKTGITVATGKDSLRITQLQYPGRKAVSGREFANGFRVIPYQTYFT